MFAAAATGERHLIAQYAEERQWAETNFRELHTWLETICVPISFYNIISSDTSDCQLPGDTKNSGSIFARTICVVVDRSGLSYVGKSNTIK